MREFAVSPHSGTETDLALTQIRVISRLGRDYCKTAGVGGVFNSCPPESLAFGFRFVL